MAITLSFTSQPELITPVYNDVVFVIASSLDIADKKSRIEITLTVNGTDRIFNVSPNSVGGLSLNISKILQQFIESEIEPAIAFISINTSTLLTYTLAVKAISSTENTTIFSTAKYAFNGATQDFEDFDYNDYLMNSTKMGLLLNNYGYLVKTKLTDSLIIQAFNGTFNSIDYGISGITIDVLYKNGSIDTETVLLSTFTTNGICILDISPEAINNESDLLLDETVVSYSVRGSNGEFAAVVVEIIETDVRFNNDNRIAYINHLGATNYIGFNIGFTENLSIQKETFQSNSEQKVYNIEAENSMVLISEYMTEEESIAIKDLWLTPVAMDQNDRKIIMDVSQITIKRKRNDGLISYSVPFIYAKAYRSLKK